MASILSIGFAQLAQGLETVPFVGNVVVSFLVLVTVTSFLFYWVDIPAAVKFLIIGVLAGPHALGLVRDAEVAHGLAEVGALLLFFLAGSRLSMVHLAYERHFFAAGLRQVGLGITLTTSLVVLLGKGWQAAVFTGFLVSMSSTTLSTLPLPGSAALSLPANVTVQRMLRIHLVLALPMLLFIHAFGRVEGALAWLGPVLLMCLAFVALVVIFCLRRIPDWLDRTVRERGREALLGGVLALGLGVALAARLVGLGLALGAFLAGQLLSRYRYNGRTLSEAVPLHIVFSAFFLVPMGILVDLHFLWAHPLLVLGTTAGALLFRLIITSGSIIRLNDSAETIASASFAMLPLGELSFLLFYAGREIGLAPGGLGPQGEQLFVAVSVLLVLYIPVAAATRTAQRSSTWISLCKHRASPYNRSHHLAPGPESQVRLSTDHLHFAREKTRSLSCTCDDTCAATCREPFVVVQPPHGTSPHIRMMTVDRGAPAEGCTLRSLALRRRLGVIPMAVWRRDTCVTNGMAELRLEPGDRVVLSACAERLALSTCLFDVRPLDMR